MDNFLSYLRSSKKTFDSGDFTNIHIVLGNESCDLDSTFSPLALAYLLNKNKKDFIPQDAVVLPVINMSEENFSTQTENNYLLKKFNIGLDLITFRNEINFENLIKQKNVTASIVDHHILTPNDIALKNVIRLVFDHRPIDPQMNWDQKLVTVVIKQIGSCATLISDEYLKVDQYLLFKELAFLLYATILYDTVALKPEAGRAKEIDIKIVNEFEKRFKFEKDRQTTFEEVRNAHMDVSGLTPKQLLLRDLKIVNNIPVPGLPMLVEDFLKVKDNYDAVVKYADDFCWKTVVLIGLDTRGEVRRDVAVYWKDSPKLKDLLVKNLKNSQTLKGYDFSFTENNSGLGNVVSLRQGNTKLSRKQIVPIIKDTSLEVTGV